MATRKSTRASSRRLARLLARERELWAAGYARVAGVDEAGMGPLAGPVIAAAVIFAPGEGLHGVNDSKLVAAGHRLELAAAIRARALAWCVVGLEPPEIDRLNIYQAGREAMRRALAGLALAPDFVLVDGRARVDTPAPQQAVVKGDRTCHAIAAASILAKTERDRRMSDYDERYPGYDFASHKGYATAAHRAAIRRLGPCPIHRRSFTLLPHPRLFD